MICPETPCSGAAPCSRGILSSSTTYGSSSIYYPFVVREIPGRNLIWFRVLFQLVPGQSGPLFPGLNVVIAVACLV